MLWVWSSYLSSFCVWWAAFTDFWTNRDCGNDSHCSSGCSIFTERCSHSVLNYYWKVLYWINLEITWNFISCIIIWLGIYRSVMYVCYVCRRRNACVCVGRYCHLKFFEVVSRNQDRYYTRHYRQLKLPILIPIPILVFTHFLCLSASLLFSTALAISIRNWNSQTIICICPQLAYTYIYEYHWVWPPIPTTLQNIIHAELISFILYNYTHTSSEINMSKNRNTA